MNLRASRLPLAFHCPGSLRDDPGEIRIEIENEGGALGSAVHAVLAEMVMRPNGEYPDVRPFALKYGVEADDLGRLVSYGAHAWRAVRQYYPNPVTEQALEYQSPTFHLTAHLDVTALGEDWANFADWKSGYKQADYYHQLMAYALVLFATYPFITAVRATIVWLRDWSQETILVTADDVSKWEDELTERVVNWNGTYTAGAHCQFCPRFAACPARQALVRSAIAEIGPALCNPSPLDAHPVLDPMSAIVLAYREGKLSILKGVLKTIDEMIHTRIAATGPIDLGNGRELALVPEPRETIDSLKSWPILSGYLTQEELAGCVKIGKTTMLDAIGDKAPKGRKAKAKEQVMVELKAAEAVSTQTIFKLRERKIAREVSHGAGA
jgi:hypothetical protein